MASIEKHGSGWRVVWREGGRGAPKIYRGAPTKALALEVKREVERNLALYGKGTAPPARVAPALYVRLKAWSESLALRLVPRTVQQYRDAGEILLDYLGERDGVERAEVPITALDRDGLVGWHGWLIVRGRTRSTAAKRVHTLTLAWRWLYDGEDRAWLTPPPLEALARTEPRDEPTAATWAQADAAVRAAGHLPWLQRVAILARYTGLRRSEILRLTRDDLDLEAEPAAATLRSSTTKGRKSGRRIPLSAHLVELLRTWPGAPDGHVVDAPELERVAARGHGRGHVDRCMRRAWARSGAPPAIWHGRPIHGFRHVLETELLAAGARWEGVEALVGHKLPGTGGTSYAAARAVWPHMVEAVKLIPKLDLDPDPTNSVPFPGSRALRSRVPLVSTDERGGGTKPAANR